MLTNQPNNYIDIYQKQIRQLIQDIRHNIKFLQKVATDLSQLSGRKRDSQRDVLMQRGQGLRVELKEKLKAMEGNVGEVVGMVDWKLAVVVGRLAKLERQIKDIEAKSIMGQDKLSDHNNNKQQQQLLKQTITQLQQQIFTFQKVQNQHTKQISLLKQRNAQLREQFTNLSFDSNQRIKQLSQKLHNNTSPNLGIRGRGVNGNNINTASKMEMSYVVVGNSNNNNISGQLIQFQRRNNNNNFNVNNNNNFVKIKGNGNNLLHEMCPSSYNAIKTNKPTTKHISNNILVDSFVSESSQFDIKPYGDTNQQPSKLMLGCFPAKQNSQKTKTGSSSENNNKKNKLQQSSQKSRRFQFLLNNLIDDSTSGENNNNQLNDVATGRVNGEGYGRLGYSSKLGNQRRLMVGNNIQSQQQLQQNNLYKDNSNNPKSVFSQNLVKRYQI